MHIKTVGPGPCPLCGSDTVAKTNRVLGVKFYGCTEYPECKGSRDDCQYDDDEYKKVEDNSNKESAMSLTMNNMNNKMMDRFFKKVDGVVWDLMSGKVGIQSHDGISTLEGEGDDAQVSLNMLDQFGMPVPAFAQSTPVDKVKKGDLIYVNDSPKGWVIEVKEGDVIKFKLMSPSGSSATWTPPKVTMFGLESGVMVLKSLIEMLPEGEDGLSGMQGNLMPLMMMGGDGGDMEKIMPMLLMSQMGGMGGAGAGANNMVQMMMMMKMMGGKGGSFGGGFFDE
jgi:ssDNA-binding Zn-finger/Zn-ribbon topoisomerase 1